MKTYKTLKAWREARKVTLSVLGIGHRPSPVLAPLLSQLRRSSLSVQLNIAEGYAYGTPAVFKRHLNIAYGSAIETGELLEILADSKLLGNISLDELLEANRESQRLTLGLIKHLKSRQAKPAPLSPLPAP